MPNKQIIIVLSLILVLFTASAALAEITVALTHGTNRHRPDFGFEAADEYRIYCAKNEWEPFMVLIRNDEALSNMDVTVGEFTGPGDNITEIEPYRVHYLPVDINQISHEPPDPSRAGLWPDALVPFVDHFDYEDRDGAPFDLPAYFAQGIFVDVYVPEDQTPGDYEATVNVLMNNNIIWTGAISLTVWDFALPNGMSLNSNYQYSQDQVCEYFTEYGSLTDCEEMHQKFFESYGRHRMSPYRWAMFDPTATWDTNTQTLTLDWDAWDAYHGPYLDGTFYKPGFEFQNINLERSHGGKPEELTPEDWDRLNWAARAEHFREKGWIDKAWLYLPDEPDPSEYQALRDTAALLHEADPDLQPFVTEQYEEELGPDIDIWCPDEPMFSDSIPWLPHPEIYEQLRAQGAKTWWYNCVSATVGFDYSNHMVDQESSYMRIWLWLTRRYEFTGILFWRITYLWTRQDVWESMYAEKFDCQGDGTLYYPGTPDKIGGTTDIPIPSLRIKYLREAMEDYEYFHILDERGDKEWMDAVARTVAPKTWQWEHDWEKLLDWRRIVAEKITGDLDENAPQAPSNIRAESQVESVALSWTPPADDDLAGFDVFYSVYEGDEFFGGALAADARQAVVSGLVAGREHSFWIQSFDENGNRSPISEIVSATPLSEGDDDADDEHNPNGVFVSGASDKNASGSDADDEDDDAFGGFCG